MVCPNFNEEKKLWKKGYKYIAGLDEAGRGPLAGPVVAAAVIINFKFKILNYKIFKKIKDSKKMTPKARGEVYNIITNHPDIKWGAGIVSEKIIDKINILEATKLAMQKSIKNLNPDFLVLDGNFKINLDEAAFAKGYGPLRQSSSEASGPKQKSIIKGDSKVFSISVASIIAKVTRDKIMKNYHKKYPQYGFDRHKGYGTAFHFKAIEKYGPCKIHRKSFYPISSY